MTAPTSLPPGTALELFQFPAEEGGGPHLSSSPAAVCLWKMGVARRWSVKYSLIWPGDLEVKH